VRNIYPRELEELLFRIPSRDVAVSDADQKWGEVVAGLSAVAG